MNLKFKVKNKSYRIEIRKQETGSNYNVFATLFDSKGMLLGTSFKEGTSTIAIKEQFKANLNDIELLNANSRMFLEPLGNIL